MQHRRYFSENINLKKLTTLKKTQEKNKIRPVKLRVGKMQTATTKKKWEPIKFSQKVHEKNATTANLSSQTESGLL